MKYLLLLVCILTGFKIYAQKPDTSRQVEVTTAVQLKLKQDVEKELPKFKVHLETLKESKAFMEFSIDTFRVERFMSKWIALNYSDFSMGEATWSAAKLYDGLLNKYYRKLMDVLNAEDKKKLITAQKAWLAFRDSELKLIEAVDYETYTTGTLGQLSDASGYLNLIKTRTVTLFDYYIMASGNQ